MKQRRRGPRGSRWDPHESLRNSGPRRSSIIAYKGMPEAEQIEQLEGPKQRSSGANPESHKAAWATPGGMQRRDLRSVAHIPATHDSVRAYPFSCRARPACNGLVAAVDQRHTGARRRGPLCDPARARSMITTRPCQTAGPRGSGWQASSPGELLAWAGLSLADAEGQSSMLQLEDSDPGGPRAGLPTKDDASELKVAS